MSHERTVERNRDAWEANAYRAWVVRHGAPSEAAAALRADPRAPLRRVLSAVGDPDGMVVAVPLGSHGRVATSLALLGARVTVFDVSESNARYARELAAEVGVPLDYVVGDFRATASGHPSAFDAVVMDLGIVHYFVHIERFVASVRSLLVPDARLVLSEFHPLAKTCERHPVLGSQLRATGEFGRIPCLSSEQPNQINYLRVVASCVMRLSLECRKLLILLNSRRLIVRSFPNSPVARSCSSRLRTRAVRSTSSSDQRSSSAIVARCSVRACSSARLLVCSSARLLVCSFEDLSPLLGELAAPASRNFH